MKTVLIVCALAAITFGSGCRQRPSGTYICDANPALYMRFISQETLETNVLGYLDRPSPVQAKWRIDDNWIQVDGPKAKFLYRKEGDEIYFKPLTFVRRR